MKQVIVFEMHNKNTYFQGKHVKYTHNACYIKYPLSSAMTQDIMTTINSGEEWCVHYVHWLNNIWCLSE